MEGFYKFAVVLERQKHGLSQHVVNFTGDIVDVKLKGGNAIVSVEEARKPAV